jgi:hypothetical protein
VPPRRGAPPPRTTPALASRANASRRRSRHPSGDPAGGEAARALAASGARRGSECRSTGLTWRARLRSGVSARRTGEAQGVHLSCAARSSCHVGPSTRCRVPARATASRQIPRLHARATASRQIPRLHALPRARRPSWGARGWAGSEYSRDTSRGKSREVGQTWAPRHACAESGLPLSLCDGAASRRTGPVSGARKKENQAGQRGACAELRAGLRTGTASARCPSTPADGLHLTTKNRTPSRISPPRALADSVPAQGRPGISPRGWHRPPWRARGQRLVIPPWQRRCARCPASHLHLQTSALASRSRVARSVAARPLVRTRCRRCTRSGCERRCVCTARIGTGSRRADLRALEGGAGRVCWLTALLRQLRSWLSARPPK